MKRSGWSWIGRALSVSELDWWDMAGLGCCCSGDLGVTGQRCRAAADRPRMAFLSPSRREARRGEATAVVSGTLKRFVFQVSAHVQLG